MGLFLLLGDGGRAAFARDGDHPALAGPVFQPLRQIAGKRAGRARPRAEFDAAGFERHQMHVVFDVHLQHRRAFGEG